MQQRSRFWFIAVAIYEPLWNRRARPIRVIFMRSLDHGECDIDAGNTTRWCGHRSFSLVRIIVVFATIMVSVIYTSTFKILEQKDNTLATNLTLWYFTPSLQALFILALSNKWNKKTTRLLRFDFVTLCSRKHVGSAVPQVLSQQRARRSEAVSLAACLRWCPPGRDVLHVEEAEAEDDRQPCLRVVQVAHSHDVEVLAQ